LHHEPGANNVDDVVGPFVVAALFDEFVEGEGGALCVFAVFDVFAQVFEGVAVHAAFDDEVEYCGELYGLVRDCVGRFKVGMGREEDLRCRVRGG
jgi:hypothetical protein